MSILSVIFRVTLRDLEFAILVGESVATTEVRKIVMKKFVLTMAGVALALGAPTAAFASSSSCGYDACDNGGYGHDQNEGKHHKKHGHHHGGHHHDGHGGAVAKGAAVGSPGVLSGNVIQVPIHIPINACGNTVNVIGALNPAFGNVCINQ